MKKKIIFLLVCIPYIIKCQDPSFSQFDLNMMNSNPAFTSYEGGTKILLHSRNQWNRINENFNNSLFEISSRSTLNRNSRKMKVAWAYGLSFLSEDLMIFPEIGNSVFIKKKELLLFPFTLEMKITKNSYISASPLNVTFRKYDLETGDLIFSDMIDDFGNIYSIENSGFNPDIYIHNNWISDLSFGFIYTRHGQYQNSKTNRFNIGISSHHILNPIESFSGNDVLDSRIPSKFTIHTEIYSAIPSYKRPFIPYFRILFKHENYIKDYTSIMKKTEFGSTIFLNNTNLEIGSLFRINQNLENKINLHNWIPIMRYRIRNGDHLLILSYSYDANITLSSNNLQFLNTGTTHEIGLSIYLNSGNGRNKSCAAFEDMRNNPLYQDIMNNGLLNKR